MVILSGCSKGNSNTIDVAIKKGDYSSICTKEEDSDGIKVTTVTTTNYGKDKYAISMKVKAIYEFEKFASRTNGNDIGIFDYNKLFPEAKEIYNILLSIRNDKKTS